MKSTSRLIIADVDIKTSFEKHSSHITVIVEPGEDADVAIKNQIIAEMIRLKAANLTFSYAGISYYWKLNPSLLYPEDDPRMFIDSAAVHTSESYKSVNIQTSFAQPVSPPATKIADKPKKKKICFGCQVDSASQKDHLGGCVGEEESSSSSSSQIPDLADELFK